MGWNDDKPVVFDTPKPFGEVMKEFNEEANKSITIVNETNQPQVIIGLDQGSPSGDKSILSIFQDGKYHLVGESIELSIPEGWSAKTVQAIQIGDLAVVTTEDEERCIAHVPTQTWFDNAVPDGEYTVEQLCLWAWKVQQATGPNWTALRAYNNSNYKNISTELLNSVKAYCLSVSI